MSDLENPDIRAGAEAFKICRDGIRRAMDNDLFIGPFCMYLGKYFRSLYCRKASRKNFKRRRW